MSQFQPFDFSGINNIQPTPVVEIKTITKIPWEWILIAAISFFIIGYYISKSNTRPSNQLTLDEPEK